MRVVIAGAGILGLGTAHALAELEGIETTVLDALRKRRARQRGEARGPLRPERGRCCLRANVT